MPPLSKTYEIAHNITNEILNCMVDLAGGDEIEADSEQPKQ